MESLKRALTRLFVFVMVVGLLGAVGFLLAKLNARTFTLAEVHGELLVLKGRELPMGNEPFHSLDPGLAEAYAPIPLDGMAADPTLLEQHFTDRDELNRALFELLSRLAGPRVASDDPSALERGFYYLRRAEKLSGLTTEQRSQLQRMKADASFYLGRLRLDDARRDLAEGLAQLHAAADSQNKHSRNANQMLMAVEPSVQALEDALRAAVNALSAPPPTAIAPVVPLAPARLPVDAG